MAVVTISDGIVSHNIGVPGAIVFSTAHALLAPGTAATFKIYTFTTEGNERGSNPVTLTRSF